MSLKALALKVLERNRLRNADATPQHLPRNSGATASPPSAPDLTDRIRAMARRWDYAQDELSEALKLAARDPTAYLVVVERDEAAHRYEATAAPQHTTVRCAECEHFQRGRHPHLGHCAAGEPEAIAGLWDSDSRSCTQWLPLARAAGGKIDG